MKLTPNVSMIFLIDERNCSSFKNASFNRHNCHSCEMWKYGIFNLKLFLRFIDLTFYGNECFACMYVCVPHTCLRLVEGIRSPELELQLAVSYLVSAEKQVQVFCKSSQGSNHWPIFLALNHFYFKILYIISLCVYRMTLGSWFSPSWFWGLNSGHQACMTSTFTTPGSLETFKYTSFEHSDALESSHMTKLSFCVYW